MSRLRLKSDYRRHAGPAGPSLVNAATGKTIQITGGEDALVSLMKDGRTPEQLLTEVTAMGVPVRLENVQRALARLMSEGVLVDLAEHGPSVVVESELDALDELEDRPTAAMSPEEVERLRATTKT